MACKVTVTLAIAGVLVAVLCLFLTSAQEPHTASIRLNSGMNQISLPLIPASSAPADVLASIEGKYSKVYAWDAATQSWLIYSPGAPSFLNTLTTITETMGFQVWATEAVTLTVTGTTPTSSTIPLRMYTNLIGYPLEQTLPITVALESISGKYSNVMAYDSFDPMDPWKQFDPSMPVGMNDLLEMRPGMGYTLTISEACVLRLPPESVITPTVTPSPTETATPTPTSTPGPTATPSSTPHWKVRLPLILVSLRGTSAGR